MSEKLEVEKFNIALGKNIRKYRLLRSKSNGVRQIDIAEYVGVKYQAIWMWENGKVTISSYHLYKIAEFLNVSIVDLIPEKI